MDTVTLALWLATQGAALIEVGKQLWAANGKDPAQYEAAVEAARAARAQKIAAQRSAELKALEPK